MELSRSEPNRKILYYIVDEYRMLAYADAKNPRRYHRDILACARADLLFVTSPKIAENRSEHAGKTIVIGNGSRLPPDDRKKGQYHFLRSVGIVGVFRDWIDVPLLEVIIKSNPGTMFVFAGPIQDKMNSCFHRLLDGNLNTTYMGIIPKEDIYVIYDMIDLIIVPYCQTAFIAATRPIKINEAVIAGRPVVTVPVSGYSENMFIRFARTTEDFNCRINELLETPPIWSEEARNSFLQENLWNGIANRMLGEVRTHWSK